MKKKILVDFLRPLKKKEGIEKIKSIFSLSSSDVVVVDFNNSTFSTWLNNFTGLSDLYEGRLESVLSRDFLYIGWELSPSICMFLKNNSYPFLSLGVSPIRLFNDFDLYMVSNHYYDIGLKWGQYIDEKKAEFRGSQIDKSIENCDYPYSENYIFEQLPLDAASIYENKFCGLSDVLMFYGLNSYMLIGHPHSRIRGRGVIRKNKLAYSMLKYEETNKMFTFSSSLQYESLIFENKNKISSMHDYYSLYRDCANFELVNNQQVHLLTGEVAWRGEIKKMLSVKWW